MLLGLIRLLRRIDNRVSRLADKSSPEPFDPALVRQMETALHNLPAENEEARQYLGKHIPRLARTLALAPPPGDTGRVLELGCYMQITPLLKRVCGYREVRGAHYGPSGRVDSKVIHFPDGDFRCEIDHFDAECQSFPYPDAHFDLVIAGEIIEHMLHDPMRVLLEARRVLGEGGWLLITTPNIASLASLSKVLDARYHPGIFALYKRPGGEPDIGHMREYTAWELAETVKAAGFEIDQLFTTRIAEYEEKWPLLNLLSEHGFSTGNRGEQSWCLARKRSSLPIDRYPWFLYSP